MLCKYGGIYALYGFGGFGDVYWYSVWIRCEYIVYECIRYMDITACSYDVITIVIGINIISLGPSLGHHHLVTIINLISSWSYT